MLDTPEKLQTPIDLVRAKLEAMGREFIEKDKGWIVTSCPVEHNHKNGDSRPSFGFREIIDNADDTDRAVAFNCFGECTHKEILDALGLKEKDLYSNPDGKGLAVFRYSGQAKQALTLREYSEYTLLPLDFLMIHLGLHDTISTFHKKDGTPYKIKGVAMPCYLPDGTPYEKAKIRTALKKTTKSSNFVYSEGDEHPIAYGQEVLFEAKNQGFAIIDEGESDWQTLRYHGYYAVGIPGADQVKNTLDASMFEGIPIVYVIQEKTDQAGMNFPYKVQLQLQKTGYTGKILRIPLKTLTGAKDPSDLHKQLWDKDKPSDHERFREEFQKVLDHARPMDYDTAEPQRTVDTAIVDKAIETENFGALLEPDFILVLAQLNRAEYALYKDKIREAFGKRANLSDLNAAVSEARKLLEESSEKPSLDIIADDFAENHKEDWAFNALSSAWYEWTGTHWQNMQDTEAQKKSCVTLDRIVRDLMRARDLGINKSSDLDCVVRLAAIHCKRSFVSTPGVVNFRNGTLEVNTGILRAHDRDDQLTYCLPYGYEAHGQWPVICGFLQDLFPDKYARQNYMVHIGLSLMEDAKMHYADAIIGPPRVGKSTALDLANLTCGLEEKKYAGKTLFNSDLEGKRARYMQNKKRIVCIDELPVAALRNEETVKNMMAHSGVEMRGMMKDEELDNRWRPKIFMAMNERPEYKDTSGAIKERIVPLMVSATRPKDKRDLQLIEKMKPELGGFAASCIRLAQAALQRGYYPLSGFMKAIINEMEAANNPLKSFIQEECILDPEGFMFTDELYDLYKPYCTSANNIPLAKYKMSNELTQMGKGITQKRKRNPFKDNEVQRGLSGIRLRHGGDKPLEEEASEEDDLMLSVDDVDDMLTTLFLPRQQDKSASQADAATNVDDVDDTFEKHTCREDIIKKNGSDREGSPLNMSNHTFSSNMNNTKMSSTSSTDGINPLVESIEYVDDVPQPSSTRRQRRQQASIPVWLTPGTSDWNKLVARVGLKEANDRRQAALRPQS